MIEFSELLAVIYENWMVIILFFLVAIVYSSVGFGGGTSYLALLAFTSLSFVQIRAISLLCNIVVVSSGTFIYAKNGYYNWKKVLPLVLMSVPLAFLGGYLKIGQAFFFIVLGITLIIAAFFMWISKYIRNTDTESKNSIKKDSFFGGIIGFFSGMVGVGGGVFLAPLLHLTKWDTPKRIVATSSFFILVNSVAGLVGQYLSRSVATDFYFEPHIALVLMLVVFIGGQIGSRLSVAKISPILLKQITAVLIALVGLKLLYTYFF